MEFEVSEGTTPGIVEYYRTYLGAVASAEEGVARIRTGPRQELRLREKPGKTLPVEHDEPYETALRGYHVAMYLYDHMGSMQTMAQHGLLWPNPRYKDLDAGQGLNQF
eukprot:scaffold155989_cov36-Prasinocladus_malaysianus.AAC.1